MKHILFLLLLTGSIFANIGNIMALKGKATLHRTSQQLPVQSGMPILQGDKISTSGKTRVQIILKDDTIITVGANSSISFDTFSYDGTKKSTIQMSSKRGFFRSVTGKIGKIAPERFMVKTSSATIGIRGTDFSVLQAHGIERFTCHRGGIRVKIGNKVRDLAPGESFEFKSKKGPLTHDFEPKTYDVSDITDGIEPNAPLDPGYFGYLD